MLSISLVGFNHRTAPIDLRERFSLMGCGLRMALADLRSDASPSSAQQAGLAGCLGEAVLLSTCNRLEFYATSAEPQNARLAMEGFLSRLQGVDPDSLRPYLIYQEGQEAIRHLMRVASGLESMILGEPQILGQVAHAYTEAQVAGTGGPVLSQLFSQAVHCGKRARTETAIGSYTTSLSHAAARRACKVLGSLAGRHALVVGAGEMAALAALALRQHGIGQVTCISRTFARAEQLACRVEGRALGWHQLEDALAKADVVISATAAPHTIITYDHIARALGRKAVPFDPAPSPSLLLIDLALPRDIDLVGEQLPGVVRLDLDHLRDDVDVNRARREAAVPDVEHIVAEEAAALGEWIIGRQVVPALVELRRKAESVASLELQRTLRRLQCDDPRVEDEVRQLAHRLVNKLLHEPTIRLKTEAAAGNGATYASLVEELFALGSDSGRLACGERGERCHG